jgi:HK97 family phage major capsid protein
MKELIEKKNDLITRAEDVLNVAKAEKRELTEDEAAELAEIRDNVRKIIETLKLDDDFREIEKEKMEVKEDDTPKEEVVEVKEEQRAMEIEMQERNAFENYLRGRVIHERAGELTPATSGSGIGLGGALIPETIVNHIIRKVYDICPILDRSQKFNVKGTLEVPYYPADSQKINVAYQTEFVQLTSSSGSFATVSLTGFLAGALTKISRSLINNVQFDIVGFVVDEMAYAIKRFIEHELLIGTSGKVEGLSGLTNQVTTGSASAIVLNDIINVHDAIKDDFQSNAIWIMSPATRTKLREITSETGYPLLNDDISTPFGTSILGKPVYVSDNMPDIGAGEDVIYYGDMHGLATKFNEEVNIEVLRERYADEHAIGVIGWFEFDSKVIDEQQIAKLTMAGGSASE